MTGKEMNCSAQPALSPVSEQMLAIHEDGMRYQEDHAQASTRGYQSNLCQFIAWWKQSLPLLEGSHPDLSFFPQLLPLQR